MVSEVWSFYNPLCNVGIWYGDLGTQQTFDKIDKTINQGSQQAVTLWQRILKKAFEGRLV